ncbi:hypothetical protein SteCoe_1447 [Stentor coeruleus]|uniref:Uncharacterized protein n=1 Tax=Stentor coeruleus TaxID=5963 RepID=A0A1R2D1U5_9CILI|nr:hypothetical protein SteCoe_1447 [Stentor coeruleus]
MIRNYSCTSSEFFTSRGLRKPKGNYISPRPIVHMKRIFLSRGSSTAFMLLSTDSSKFPSIHAHCQNLLKQTSTRPGIKLKCNITSSPDLKIHARKVNLNVKYRA